jgi:hypothetical protein
VIPAALVENFGNVLAATGAGEFLECFGLGRISTISPKVLFFFSPMN